jgi:RimJ/RimL family protein N-acetyltransferase
MGAPQQAHLWTYMFDGPFGDRTAFAEAMKKRQASNDPLFFAFEETKSNRAVGIASYMRIEPSHRVIEVGGIVFSPALQRRPGATEAMYLMVRHVFEDLGYRRYEWKCDALNAPSRRAALRLGFTFEGIFRQHMIVKGRNRDTAWFSMLDTEWPARKAAFEAWLAPDNFEANGMQKQSLFASNAARMQ